MGDNSLERLWDGRSGALEHLLGGIDGNVWETYSIILLSAAADAHIATRRTVGPYASREDADRAFVRGFLDSVSAALRELPDTIAPVEVGQIPLFRTIFEIDGRTLRDYLNMIQS